MTQKPDGDCAPFSIRHRAHLLRCRAFTAWLLCCACLAGCATPTQRAQRIARQAGMQETLLPGTQFLHRSFFVLPPHSHTLAVFIEGDGSPWIDNGERIASDPTARQPLALQLAAQTPGAVLYLGRPCYLELAGDASCSSRQWADGRYSQDVIASMIAALNGFVRAHDVMTITLIGYSGGGTIAVLMGNRMPEVQRVVTIAANLDIAAWTALHGCRPLKDSLNPAEDLNSARSTHTGIEEIHLSGALDTNVPPSSIDRYLQAHPMAQVRSMANFDHVCCWARQWKMLWHDIDRNPDSNVNSEHPAQP